MSEQGEPRDIRKLVDQWLDGDESVSEQIDAILRDPETRREALREAHLLLALPRAIRGRSQRQIAGVASSRLVSRPRRTKLVRFSYAAVAATLAAMATTAVVLVSRDGQSDKAPAPQAPSTATTTTKIQGFGTVASLRGAPTVSGSLATIGMVVPDRAAIAALGQDSLTIESEGKARIELTGGNCRIGSAIELESGKLYAEVKPHDPSHPFIVRTALADAVVVGTVLSVEADAWSTELAVEHGRVRFVPRDGTEAQLVEAGHHAMQASVENPVPALSYDFASGRPFVDQGALKGRFDLEYFPRADSIEHSLGGCVIRNGQSLASIGRGDSSRLNDAITASRGISIEAVIKVDGPQPAAPLIVAEMLGFAGIDTNDTNLVRPYQVRCLPSEITPGWHHWIHTVGADGRRTWLDGRLVETNPVGSDIGEFGAPYHLKLGHRGTEGTTLTYAGVAVFTRELTQGEITVRSRSTRLGLH